MKTYGLDFDGTFTSDPEMFRIIVALMQSRGHTVVMVTQRCKKFLAEIEQVLDTCVLPIVFSSGLPKEVAAARAGYKVDVWIDDSPFSILNALTYRGC